MKMPKEAHQEHHKPLMAVPIVTVTRFEVDPRIPSLSEDAKRRVHALADALARRDLLLSFGGPTDGDWPKSIFPPRPHRTSGVVTGGAC